MCHRLRGTSHTELEKKRPFYCASQWSTWQNPLSYPSGLILIISTRQTSNPSGPYHIIQGYLSMERQGQRDEERCDDHIFMESTDWCHHWCQNLETLTQNTTDMRQWKRSWIGGKLSRKISKVSTVTINRNVFFHLFFLFFTRTGLDKYLNCNRGC